MVDKKKKGSRRIRIRRQKRELQSVLEDEKDLLKTIIAREKQVEVDKEDIERRLLRAERELDHIGKKDLEVLGVDRIKGDIHKMKKEVSEMSSLQLTKDRRTTYGLLAVIAFLGILVFDIPGLTVLGQRAIAIFLLVAVLWVTEVIPLPATAFIPGVLLFLMGIKDTPTEAFATYAHQVVFFIIGVLLIAQGLIQSGLGKRIAYSVLKQCRNNANLLLLLIILISAALSMFVSEKLVVPMMLPVILAIVATTKLEGNFRISLVLGLVFGGAVAAIATPSGSSANAIVLALLEEITGASITYGMWMKAILPITLLTLPIIWLTLRYLFPPPPNLEIEKAMNEYGKGMKPMSSKEWRVLGVFLLTIVLFITTSNVLGLGIVALIGAILMFLVGGVNWEEAEKGVRWGIIFIYGAAITMGLALQETGATAWVAGNFLSVFPNASPLFILAAVIIFASALSSFMSDAAAASILAPITLNLALATGLSVTAVALATGIASGYDFLFLFGSAPLAIAFSSGYFNPKELFKAGIFIQIAVTVITILVAVKWWTVLGLF